LRQESLQTISDDFSCARTKAVPVIEQPEKPENEL
jgi:hypothetical protein